MPWRRRMFKAMPWLPAARVSKGYHDRLYGAWMEICEKLRTMEFAENDPSFTASIAQQRDLDTGE